MNVEKVLHRARLLDSMLRLPGYIDDVARHMLALARQPNDREITRYYCGVRLQVVPGDTVDDVRRYFERAKWKEKNPIPIAQLRATG